PVRRLGTGGVGCECGCKQRERKQTCSDEGSLHRYIPPDDFRIVRFYPAEMAGEQTSVRGCKRPNCAKLELLLPPDRCNFAVPVFHLARRNDESREQSRQSREDDARSEGQTGPSRL